MEWKTVKIEDCLSCIIDNRGKTPKELTLDGHPLLEINVVSQTYKFPLYTEAKKYVNENTYKTWFRSGHPHIGDILVPTVGTLGAVSYVNRNDCCIAQNLIALRVNSSLCDSEFLYYQLRNPETRKRLLNLDIGAVQASIKVPHLKALEISIPPLATQRRIASILSSLDAQIENNNRINRNLEEQAAALFKSWFVDFEPWGGKMPEDWREGCIFDVAEVLDKKRKPLSGNERDKMKKLYPYYGATSCMDHVEDYLFDGIFTLLGEDGSVVKEDGTPYVQYVWGKLWVNNHAHVLQGKNGYSTEMLHAMLSQLNIVSLVTGAVQAKLNQGNMQKIKVVIASDDFMQMASRTIGALYANIRNNQQQSSRLATLRDTLLPKLMKGEIEV